MSVQVKAPLKANKPQLATELLSDLVQYGSEPLPAGFVATTLPKLSRLLMTSTEGEVLRPGAEAVKYMLMHDHHQVFGWHDESGRSGLEVCLLIIDRLLGSSVEDNAASEVGGLAAELVEKAGPERLGPFLAQLLQAVATRLASAQAAPFIQSLILVFARLSLVGAHDVVEFLSQIQIEGQSGLQVVLGKWLENSINFAGYDEIRQKYAHPLLYPSPSHPFHRSLRTNQRRLLTSTNLSVIALSKLYSLNDPRIAQTQVKGDLIPNTATEGRIMTRSRAKQSSSSSSSFPKSMPWCIPQEELESHIGPGGAATSTDPDTYTVIPATLKILKVLIEELLSASGAQGAANAAAAAVAEFADADLLSEDGEGGDDDGWEDDGDGTLDLSSLGVRHDLMSFMEGSNIRQRDDETQAYLTEFFVTAARENVAGFQDWYALLTEDEKAKLNELAAQQQ